METTDGLFESTVPYYARYRSGYPAADVAALVQNVGLTTEDRVLDIGCGTGLLSIPLARCAGQVVAVDPVPSMLAAGREAAAAAGVDNIRWVVGSSADLAQLVRPGARLATFAASFHWTDRPAVLAGLDRLLAEDGVVAVIHDGLSDSDLPDWDHAITEVRARYAGLTPHSGAVAPMRQSHLEVLEASAFGDVETMTWAWSRQLNLDEVVGLQLTYSFSSPALLGERLEAFSADVRAAVLALYPDGIVTEPFRADVSVARRSHGARTGRS